MDDTTPGAAPAGPVSERMQVLLTRAVEEQASDQRGVTVAFADLGTQMQELTGRVEQRLGELGDRLTAISDASAGAPALTGAVGRLSDQVQELAGQLAGIVVPDAQEIATLIQQRVADELVDSVAARVGDLVRATTAESEARVVAHVDEAVLALAEALLRRRGNGRGGGDPALDPSVAGIDEQPGEQGPADAPAVRGAGRQRSATGSRTPGRPRRFETTQPAGPSGPASSQPGPRAPDSPAQPDGQDPDGPGQDPDGPGQEPGGARQDPDGVGQEPTDPAQQRRPWWRSGN